MTTEERFCEKWKELEAAVRLAFPTWDGRTVENFLKQMRVEGVDFTRLMALRMARNALTHNPKLNDKPIVTLNEGVLPLIGILTVWDIAGISDVLSPVSM